MDTKTRLIEAAEVRFARDGYSATSVRDVTDAAGANVAAVNYHFGSKEGLLTAVLDRIVGPIVEERHQLLDDLEEGGEPTVREVLTAFLLPDIHAIEILSARDPELPRFVSRMYTEGSDLMEGIMTAQFSENQRRFYAAFGRALPSLDIDEIGWRLQCIVGIVIYLFAGIDPPGVPSLITDDTTLSLRRLLAITVPIFSAEVVEVSVPS